MGEGPALTDPFHLVDLIETDSTNEEAKRRLNACGNDDHITVLWARSQTAGKGRRGRAWVSEPGNLYCSFVLNPGCPAAGAVQLGFVAANTVASAIASKLPEGRRVTCKWPNDVLIEGRKAAGLLLEADAGLDRLIIGIGVNLAHHPENTDFPATSLAHEGGGEVSAGDFLETLCLAFLDRLTIWRNSGFAPVRRAWLDRAHGLGAPVAVRLERETLHGTFKNLDGDGALILDQGGRERLITAGDVFPLAAPKG